MKISELTHAEVTTPDMEVPVELYGQTMHVRMDQVQGKDAIVVTVVSDRGTTILNGTGERTLTAYVKKGEEDITDIFGTENFSWRRVSQDVEGDEAWNQLHVGVGNVITVTADDVLRIAQFFCDVMV